jgi:hypothetical protein
LKSHFHHFAEIRFDGGQSSRQVGMVQGQDAVRV